MRRTFFIILIVILLIPILWIGYSQLPIEITRKNDIEFGNKLISKIQDYENKNSKLPLTDDWKTLEKLGFKTELLGIDPTYNKISNDEYELIFLEGFDGPYLLYNSKSKRWKIDFPKFQKKEKAEKVISIPTQ